MTSNDQDRIYLWIHDRIRRLGVPPEQHNLPLTYLRDMSFVSLATYMSGVKDYLGPHDLDALPKYRKAELTWARLQPRLEGLVLDFHGIERLDLPNLKNILYGDDPRGEAVIEDELDFVKALLDFYANPRA